MKVADLTVEELKIIIEDIVQEELEQYFGDPDEGLELRPEFVRKLKKSAKHPSKKRYTMQEVAAKCGIKLEEPNNAHTT